eukprot:1976956-Pyramimonas_sp.AAC.2
MTHVNPLENRFGIPQGVKSGGTSVMDERRDPFTVELDALLAVVSHIEERGFGGMLLRWLRATRYCHKSGCR